jgi:hypothetical protein
MRNPLPALAELNARKARNRKPTIRVFNAAS